MANVDDAFQVKKPRIEHPKGFRPGYHDKGTTGYVVTRPLDERPDGRDWSWVLEQWNLDPDLYEIEEPVEVRAWDQAIGAGEVRTAYYVKAKVRLKGSGETDPDYDSLIEWVRRRPRAKKPAPTGRQALVVCLSDWQLGKADGYGTAGTVKAVKALEKDLLSHARGLRAMGVDIRTLTVLGLGDLVEGCDGFYAMQPFTVELDRRAQIRIVKELLVSLLDAWAPHFEEVQVACVGGNHGENRKNGKAYTTFADNDDVAVFEHVRDMLTHNDTGRYEHFRWLIPDDQLSLSLDVEGTVVGLIHGHQAGNGKWPASRVWEWWRGQALGRRPVADSDVLCWGHFHQLNVRHDGGRWSIGVPTMDGGSRWFAENYGSESDAGTLTFVTSGGRVDHIRVLEGRGWDREPA